MSKLVERFTIQSYSANDYASECTEVSDSKIAGDSCDKAFTVFSGPGHREKAEKYLAALAAAEEVERLRRAIELATDGVDLELLERSARCLSIEVPLAVYLDAVQPLVNVLARMRELRAALSPPAANAGE